MEDPSARPGNGEVRCYGCNQGFDLARNYHSIHYTLSEGTKPTRKEVFTHASQGCLSRATEKLHTQFGDNGTGTLEKLTIRRGRPVLKIIEK